MSSGAARFPLSQMDEELPTLIYLSAFRHHLQPGLDLLLVLSSFDVALCLCHITFATPPLLANDPLSLPPYPHCGGCQLSGQQLVPITRALTVKDGWPTTHIHVLLSL